jgi:predicted SprT family Zn-dependent metalloprotease
LRALGAEKLAREIRVEWNPRLKTCAGRADYREKLISLNPLLLELSNPAAPAPTPGATPNLECKKHSRSANRRDIEGVRSELECKMHSTPPQSSDHFECNMHSTSANRSDLEGVLGKLECKMHSSLPAGRENGSSAHATGRGVVLDEVDRTLRHELAHLLGQWRVGRRGIAPHGKEWRRACRDLGIADEVRCHNLPFATKMYAARYVYLCPNCKETFQRVRRIRRAIACLACCRAHNRGEFDPRFRLKLIKSQ